MYDKLLCPTSRRANMWKKMGETNKLSEYGSLTFGCVLLLSVCYKSMQMLSLAVDWTVLVEAGGGEFHEWPQSPFLTE